jgi:sugar lactone lactonase YvrE
MLAAFPVFGAMQFQNLTANPPVVSPGQNITITFQYMVNAFAEPAYFAALSNNSLIQNMNTPGQSVLVSESGINILNSTQVTSGRTGPVEGAASSWHPSSMIDASIVVTVPAGWTSGTYYVIVCGKEWGVLLNPMPSVDNQISIPINVSNSTPTLTPTMAPQAAGYFGNQAVNDGPSSLNLDSAAKFCYMKFSVPAAKTLTGIRFFGFATGTSPKYKIGIQKDNGAGKPDGNYLGYQSVTPVNYWNAVSGLNIALQPSTPYYIVITYDSGTIDVSDYFMVDFGSLPNHHVMALGQYMDFMTDAGQWTGSSWFTNFMPMYAVDFSDSSSYGNPYVDAIGYQVYGSQCYGEYFRMTGATVQADRVGLYVRQAGSTPNDDLYYVLYNVDDSAIEAQGTLWFKNSSSPVNQWVTAIFPAPVTFVQGKNYRIYLASPLSGSLNNYFIAGEGDDFSSPYYDSLTYDGAFSYLDGSVNGGGTWSQISSGFDMGFRFSYGIPPTWTPTYTLTPTQTITSLPTALPNAGNTWTMASCSAPFANRSDFGFASYNGLMWIAGGSSGGLPYQDVWNSPDGINWNQVVAVAPWQGRSGSVMLPFKGKLYMIGGVGDMGYTSEIWSTVNGTTWNLETTAPFIGRDGLTAVVYNNEIWVIGGFGPPGGLKKDVWHSANGVDWAEATGNAAFGPRSGHTSVVMNGFMWVIAGANNTQQLNDVWYSSDGAAWTQMTNSAGFDIREGHASAVYDGKMWVIGGQSGSGTNEYNDAWYSSTGSVWTSAAVNGGFAARSGLKAAVFNNQIWMAAGYNDKNGSYFNDVWYSPFAGTVTPVNTCVPPATPTPTVTPTATQAALSLILSQYAAVDGCVNCGDNITYSINYTLREKPAASISGAIYSMAATKLVGAGQTYTTISAALAAAVPNDVIEVEDSGVYVEQVNFINLADNTVIILRAKPGQHPVIACPDSATSQVVQMDRNCVISGFRIDGRNIAGSGIFNFSGNGYSVDRCEIYNCTGTGILLQDSGTHVYSSYSPIYVTNCIIRNISNYNNTWGFGARIMGMTARPGLFIHIWNCDLYNNYEGLMEDGQSSTNYDVKNCIVWGNSQFSSVNNVNVSYSIFEGPLTGFGPGCNSTDPLFVNPQAGNFYLQTASTAINSGTGAGMTAQAPYDMDLLPRPMGAGWDMGAYEYEPGDCGKTVPSVSIWDTIPAGLDFVWASSGYSMNGSVVSWLDAGLCQNIYSNTKQLVLSKAACPVLTPVMNIGYAKANDLSDLTPVAANPAIAEICTAVPTPAQNFCEAVTTAPFDPRSGPCSVVFNGEMWMLAGSWGTTYYGDAWHSSDGVNWLEKTASGFPVREGAGAAVLNGNMYIIGGNSGTGYLSDVWTSSDGQTWIEKSANGGFTKRFGHTVLSYNNRLWVIGGNDGSEKNDVWSSSDGATWVTATASAAFSGREGHASVVMNGLMWVIGGYDGSNQLNDVWSSSDGATWTQVTGTAGFSERYYHSAVVYGGQMYVINGNDGTELGDVWRSGDGITWEVTSPAAEFPARDSMAAYSFNGRIWITGGSASLPFNDVWDLCTGLAATATLTPTYTMTPSYSATITATPTITRTNTLIPTLTYTVTPSLTPTAGAPPCKTFLNYMGNEWLGRTFANANGAAVGPNNYTYVILPGQVLVYDEFGFYNSSFGTAGYGNGGFNNAMGIAVDQSGNIYVADQENSLIQKFGPAGNFITQWGGQGSADGQLNQPDGVAVDNNGNVYVADTGNNRIEKFSNTGGFALKWGGPGTLTGQFNSPQTLACDAAGNVYVTDTNNDRVQKFDPTGGFITSWGTNGSTAGQFINEHGICIDAAGNVAVNDRGNSRIEIFDLNGVFIRQFGSLGDAAGQLDDVRGVAFDRAGNIIAVDQGPNMLEWFDINGSFMKFIGNGDTTAGNTLRPFGLASGGSGYMYFTQDAGSYIEKYALSGAYIGAVGNGSGSGDGQLNNPRGIAVDTAGSVYVVDQSNFRVDKFSAAGVFQLKFGSQGTGNGQFKNAQYIAVDTAGNIYVTDNDSSLNRVQKFSPAGAYITQWGGNGTGNGQFNSAAGIAVDAAGNVYVADQYNLRVQKFDANGGYLSQWPLSGAPVGIAADISGNIWVGDTANRDIYKYSPAGVLLDTITGSSGEAPGQFNGLNAVAVSNNGDIYAGDFWACRVAHYYCSMPAATVTSTMTATPSVTPSATPTFTNTATPSVTRTATPTFTNTKVTSTDTPTITRTSTRTPTFSVSPTFTITQTWTQLPAATGTATPNGIYSLAGNIITDGYVNVVAADANGVYLGGLFSYIGPANGQGVAMNKTTGAAVPGMPEINGGGSYGVETVVSDGAGGWYIGGDFTSVAGQPRSHIAHILPNGVLDTAFNPGANGTVMGLALDGSGNIFAGGYFTEIGGQNRNYIAKLNATTGAVIGAFNPMPAGSYVQSFARDGAGNIYVAGTFTVISGQNISCIAKLNEINGAADMGFNANPNATAHAILLDGSGSLYACGDFTAIGGQSYYGLAKVDAATGLADTGFTPVVDNIMQTMALDGSGNLFIGGWFTHVNSTARNYIAKINAATGALDSTFNPGADNPVYPLVLDGSGNIYAGGNFLNINGQARGRIAKLNASTGAVDAAFAPYADNNVEAIAIDGNGNIFVGGLFSSIGGYLRQNIAKLHASDLSVDTGFNINCNNEVLCLLLQSDNLYAGGKFTNISSSARLNIAKLNSISGAADANFNPGAGAWVYSMALDTSGSLYVGGLFTMINSLTRPHLAKINASNGVIDGTFNVNGADATVYSIALDGSGSLYAGGMFGNIGGQLRNGLAKVDTTSGNADPAFNAQAAGSTITALALDGGGNIYAAGTFSSIGGISRSDIARLNAATGAGDAAFTPNSDNSVNTLVTDGSGDVFAGGNFGALGGQAISYLVKIFMSAGTVDTAFNMGVNSHVNSLCFSPDKTTLYAGGNFTQIDGKLRANFAAIHMLAGIATPTSTYTKTYTSTPTYTITRTNSATYTVTATGTPTFTVTQTSSATYTFTMTDTPSSTPTSTPTSTGTPTFTATRTQTGTFTATPTKTGTPTFTATGTPSNTPTQTGTFTVTPTQTGTFTSTPTLPPTSTYTITMTWTITETFTSTPTPNVDRVISKNYVDVSKGEVLNIRVKAFSIGEKVKIKVYNLSGELVRSIEALSYTDGWNDIAWDINNDSGKKVGQGLYFINITSGSQAVMRKVYILK